MQFPQSGAPDQQAGVVSPKYPIAKLVLPKIFMYLLLAATILSVISMLAFLAYLFLPTMTHSPAQTRYSLLYTIGVTGLAIAEACQISGIIVLIAQWLSKQNTEKKPREIAVLLISLIPFMVILVFLVTLIVYLNLRRRAESPERQKEAKQELKEQAVDTLIDYGTNLISSSASSAQIVTPAQRVAAPAMKDALRQVIGPTAAKSVSGVSNGVLVSTLAVLITSTVVMGSVAIPQTIQHTLKPLTVAGATKQTKSPPKPGSLITISLKGAQALDIIAAPNGNLWFLGEDSQNLLEIGLVTSAGSVKTFPLSVSKPNPNRASFINNIAVGSDGNLWYTDALAQSTIPQGTSGFIARITPAGAVQKFSLPVQVGGDHLAPTSIAAGPDGNIWFTVIGNDPTGAYGSLPIGRITPSGTISLMSTQGFPSLAITGSDGNLWFADGSSIGQITASGSIKEFLSPTAGLAVVLMAAGPDGNVWFNWQFAGGNSCMLGSITPTGTYHLSTDSIGASCFDIGSGVTAAPGGKLLCGTTSIGTTSPAGAHLEPSGAILCDGSLAISKSGRVWFTDGESVTYIAQ